MVYRSRSAAGGKAAIASKHHELSKGRRRKGVLLSDLLVMKFGGTSVGSAERMRVAASLAALERKKRPVLVVVSAMSKITDLLLDTMRHAEAGDHKGISSNLAILRTRHEDACRGLLPEARQP